MAWDATRRWLYISQDDGNIQIYNPTPDFDFASKVMTIPGMSVYQYSQTHLCPCIHLQS
jgi:hypothetical protein